MRGQSTGRSAGAGLLLVGLIVGSLGSEQLRADCTPEPYIGSVCLTGANFCPRGYAAASGQILQISQNTSLFSLLGCTYGGDCRSTFALPNLQGRWAMHVGQGPGLSHVSPGQIGGAEQQFLSVNQLASHSHNATTQVTLQGRSSDEADTSDPSDHILADPSVGQTGDRDIYSTLPPNTEMAATAATAETTIQNSGASTALGIRNPYLGLQYCIALQGIYPPRD